MVIIKAKSAIDMGEEIEPVALNMTAKNLAMVDGNSSSSNDLTNASVNNREENNDLLLSLSQQTLGMAGNRRNSNGVDEELTSLSWLQDNNLLKNLQVGSCTINESAVAGSSPASDSVEDSLENLEDYEEEEEDYEDFMTSKKMTDDDPHLPKHVPYDPLVHINAKPPYSFSCLIFMAIEDSANKALPVKDIYSWIVRHFPYFQNAPTGWKNSVRHNLSLNKCFSKVEKDKGYNIGKGSLWCTDPEFRPNLLQALRRSPYCAFTQLDDIKKLPDSHESNDQIDTPMVSPVQQNVNLPSPYLFPYLSKRLSYSSVKAYEVDAAATMLALKNSPSPDNMSTQSLTNAKSVDKKRKRKLYLRLRNNSTGPVKQSKSSGDEAPPAMVVSNSCVDHTYSACLDLPPEDDTGLEANPQDNDEPLNLKHINNNNNNDSAYCLSTKSEVLTDESSESSSDDETYGIKERRHSRKVSNLCKEALVIDESVGRENVEDEGMSLEEGAQALMNLANIAKIRRQSSSKLMEQKRTVNSRFSDR